MKILLPIILLVIILSTGFFLRTYRLTEVPRGFFADEAAIGFNAYRLLTTGKDEYGISFPFYFRSFGDYRTPVAIYSMIPSIAIFGLNEFSVRVTMAIYGTLTILFLYLFVKEIFWKKPGFFKETVALISALLLSISPWHIHFSRIGFEYTPMPFYLTVGLYFLFRFLNSKGKFNLILAAIFFVITFYTAYVVQLVLIPFLFSITLLWIKKFFAKDNLTVLILAFLIFFLGMIPFIYAVLNGTALTRFNNVSPLAQNKSLAEIAEPMAKTYLDHFSLDFLFLKGDIDAPGHFITRHSVRGLGELYLFQIPLLIAGFLLLLRHRRILLLMIVWLLLYPIGSTVTVGGPFSHRSFFGVVPFQIISACGIAFSFEFISKVKLPRFSVKFLQILLSIILIAALLFSVSDFTHKLFTEYPTYSADFWGWQMGPREIIGYFLAHKDQYDEMYTSGEYNGGEIFLPFYDPDNLCAGKCKYGSLLGESKIYNPNKRQLFAQSLQYLEKTTFVKDYKVLKSINYPNDRLAFLIGIVQK